MRTEERPYWTNLFEVENAYKIFCQKLLKSSCDGLKFRYLYLFDRNFEKYAQDPVVIGLCIDIDCE